MKKLFVLFLVFTSSFSVAETPLCRGEFSSPLSQQLRNLLLSISPNNQKTIENLSITPYGENSLALSSQTNIQFQVERVSHLNSPEIQLSPFRKTLQIPSWGHLSSLEDPLKTWLIGHEAHPHTAPSESILYTAAQHIAFKALKQVLLEGVASLLHIAPTGTGKTLAMAKALRENLSISSTEGLHLVTAHQIHLVDQLHQALQDELHGTGTFITNWNEKKNSTFSEALEQALSIKEPVVFVVTTQTLKQQLHLLEKEKPELYRALTQNTKGIYLDEAHHLGAFHTKSALLRLRDQSGAFFYGATATPVHPEVNIRGLFEREHWSYLNDTKTLFRSHEADKTLEQLSLAIQKGEITPFDDLYIVGESNYFNTSEEEPLFIKGSSDYYVLNPLYYNRLAGILYRILEFNPKGFIVTASIAEAERLASFLRETFEGLEFEAYHSKLSQAERREILKNSREKAFHYIVAVRALDEGVNLPHLSAYVDLNVNVSVKQMVHRIGRVLRLYPGKTGADILFMADYKDVRKAGDLLNLLEAIDLFSEGFSGGIRRPSGDSYLRTGGVLPLTREELRELRKELESSVRRFWSERARTRPSLDEAKEIVRRKGIKSVREFKERRKTDPELQLIPSAPDRTYKNEGWVDWPDFLGTKRIKPVTKTTRPSVTEAKEIVRRKKIKTSTEFYERRKTDPELQLIPSTPDVAYKDEGWVELARFSWNKKKSYQSHSSFCH